MSNKLPPILQDDNILEKLEYIFKEHFKNPPYNIPPDISWEEKAINFDKVKERYTKNNGDLKINSHLFNKANINLDRFGLSKFKKFLLKEIYIYDEEEFEREFINKVIRDEP